MSDARSLLESIIEEYSVEKFTRFFREKSQKFTPRQESYSRYDDDNFTKGFKIGEVNFSEIDNLTICAFEVTKALSEKSGKKSQYELGKKILKEAQAGAGIFIFYDQNGNFRFSLIYPESIGTRRQWNNFRRFTYFISHEFTNKTFLKQIGDKEFTKLDDIKAAFSVTAVTDIFYKEFFDLYKKIVEATKNLNKIEDDDQARDFVLLFAIRTIFLGFIQKKKWLGDDEKFIQTFYQEYKDKFANKNEFYSRWLSPLFFEALNSPQGRKVAYGDNDFSEETAKKLQMAPYLNGGLFREKSGYDTNGWKIPDQVIENFYDFLFSHSFTIEENSLEDEDLQLNPEFLGIIFERLVNKADGAVYTPRPEVDLMCRLSLVKWLRKNLESSIRVENLYELFFKESENEDEQKDGSFSPKEAQEILNILENVAICDPAVGSGAFLVGMMQVLDDVEIALRKKANIEVHNDFERKKQIIKKSLYGVEVKEWAVWICQLRLWLSLFVDAPEDLKDSMDPILPNLDFKVRQGDSLVQLIGSRNVPVSTDNSLVSGSLLKEIRELIQLKIAHYETGQPSKEDIEHREYLFYRNWMQQEITKEQNKLVQINQNEKNNQNQQSLFNDKVDSKPINLNLFQKERDEIVVKLELLRSQLRDLHRTNKPFLWQLEFSEIFSTKGGFDIVIGNPPYVRQEDIADPTGKVKDKKEYKGYLQEMVKMDFPDYFPPKAKINAQSDLYTYFYIRALRLLNAQGVHTFICSNSWLDVGYGVWLQEFLLNRCPVEIIIDNHAKRSFEAADVNTIISIIHAPQKSVEADHLVKFVAFKKSFESAIFTENLISIEQEKEVETNDIYRVYPISITNLKEAGTEFDGDSQARLKVGKYVGDKWGGKYLVAPDFIFNILVNPLDRIIKFKSVFNHSQRNNLSVFQDKAKVEKKDGTIPYLSSIKDVNTIKIDKNNLKYWIKGKSSEISDMFVPDVISNRFVSDRIFFLEGGNFAISDTFFLLKITSLYSKEQVLSLLNSTFSLLITEILGRKNLGGGLLTIYGYELERFYIVNPTLIKNNRRILIYYKSLSERVIGSVFVECGIDPRSETPIDEQDPKPLSDRAELDNIVFDALKLSEDERKDVYRAVCRLVWNRISKANSV